MGNKWTDEQLEVIRTRDKNLLVSAAAGSGKTAVLVERIIERITDANEPVDIDRILVVTFTKAAAAEMRERISNAVEKKREENPEDENLIRQSSLIHNAKITTIDSFCTFIVRNHFEEINLDPNFRIADSGELKLMEQEVLDLVFEKEYEAGKEAFLSLVDLYGTSRSNQAVKDMVMNVYAMSASSPWPSEWIAGLKKLYQCQSKEELMQTPLFEEIAESVRTQIADAMQSVDHAIEICAGVTDFEKYQQMFAADKLLLQGLYDTEGYDNLQTAFCEFSFPRKATLKKFPEEDSRNQIKEQASKIRDGVKKSLDSIRDNFFGDSLECVYEQTQRLWPVVDEIIALTLTFMKAMDERKRKKRIMDFGDIEHMALNILVDEKTKKVRPTALEFRKHFQEIMIDEYQDSNQVQDTILSAISGQEEGRYNLFMVGDVKQSIYKFRLARPELFMEKYAAYAKEDESCKRIDLHKNFRSREEVLDFSNDIFYKVMHHDLGKVDYDDAAALYPGAEFCEAKDMEAELLLLNLSDPAFEDLKQGDIDKVQLEASAVAAKIKKLRLAMPDLQYSDIVILLRSLKDWGTTFAETLAQEGIPAHVESSTGYFSATEVQTLLNFLRILDNPYQDIPMAAVLKAPFVGLDEEDLAEIGKREDGDSFSQKAVKCMQEQEEGALHAFYELYRRLRNAKDLPIHELLLLILKETGFDNYVAALPAGKKRLANVRMLVEKAIAYENTSYKGLFHFVKYIDQLQKYDVDFGEADVTSENANVVHIMTIHKSKGLEFPVVFVSGLGKQFNMMDTIDRMVIHSDLGLGIYEVRSNPKRKVSCMIRNQIADCMRRESLGEELRVLYVALTRAKEKLILTGSIKDVESAYDYTGNVMEKVPVSYTQRAKAKCYLDYILPAMLSYPHKYNISFVEMKDLVMQTTKDMAKDVLAYETLLEKIQGTDAAIREMLSKEFSFEYPYRSELDKKVKYSVSELKHASMEKAFGEKETQAAIPKFLEVERESYIPEFVMDTAENENSEQTKSIYGVSRGALRGTAVHRVMECLPFAKILEIDVNDKEQVRAFVKLQLERMLHENELTKDMYALVKPGIIEKFVESNIAFRMAKADLAGELYKEKPFVMKQKDVLIQGIIDVFWKEPDGVVILDYKTDRVENQEELVVRYKTQLELYEDALNRIYMSREGDLKTKERLIYSFALTEVVAL